MRPVASPSSSIPIAAGIRSRGTTPPASTLRPTLLMPSDEPMSIAATSSSGRGGSPLATKMAINDMPASSRPRPMRSEMVGPRRSVTRPPAITESGTPSVQKPWNRPISALVRPAWSIPATTAMLHSQRAVQASMLIPSASR